MPSINRKRIFVAGASGAIGQRMCQLLVSKGHTVIGTTRKSSNISAMENQGVQPVLVDVYEAELLRAVVIDTSPDVVVHQLTDLPPGLDPVLMPQARLRNARLREIGTRNLVDAAMAGKVGILVAQSVAFAYAPGPMPYDENRPLDLDTTDQVFAITVRAIASLEEQVLNGPFTGAVLRYGKLFGPGTGFDGPTSKGSLHVDAAADAACRAIEYEQPGVFNFAEDDGMVSIAKAKSTFAWKPDFRMANHRLADTPIKAN